MGEEAAGAGATERPTILITDRELHVLADEATSALIASNEPPEAFQHAGLPAAIRDDEDGPRIELLGKHAVRDRLSQSARWVRQSGQDGVAVVHPPMGVVDVVLSRALPLPPLDRVVTAPVLGRDGRVLVDPGYHPGSRTYYRPDRSMRGVGRYVEPVTDFEVAAAREKLLELVCDFPFATDADRANAIGLLLLPFLREAIQGPTPLHLVDAPMPGSGKSLLTEVLLRPSCGDVALMTKPDNEEEFRKKLTSALSKGPAALVLDNVSGKVDSATLAAVLTANVWEDRILGASQMASFRVRAVWAATLNNASLTNELARRSVRIRLDPDFNPQERDLSEFEHPDLRSWTREYRHLLVSAALTLCVYWVQEGRPLGATLMESFEEWARVVGGVLELAGVEGFLANRADLFAEVDDETSEVAGFLEAWHEAFGEAGVRVKRELAGELTRPGSELAHAAPAGLIDRYDDNKTKANLGLLLRQNRDKVLDGLKLVAVKQSKKGTWWAVRRMGG